MKIGNVTTDLDVFLAPMAGVTDVAFRGLCHEMGCGMVLYRNGKCESPLLW